MSVGVKGGWHVRLTSPPPASQLSRKCASFDISQCCGSSKPVQDSFTPPIVRNGHHSKKLIYLHAFIMVLFKISTGICAKLCISGFDTNFLL
jgi:hypothetical protein